MCAYKHNVVTIRIYIWNVKLSEEKKDHFDGSKEKLRRTDGQTKSPKHQKGRINYCLGGPFQKVTL